MQNILIKSLKFDVEGVPVDSEVYLPFRYWDVKGSTGKAIG
jgi:hypothetical protein